MGKIRREPDGRSEKNAGAPRPGIGAIIMLAKNIGFLAHF
jgi:hypothetical protein